MLDKKFGQCILITIIILFKVFTIHGIEFLLSSDRMEKNYSFDGLVYR